MCAVVVATLSSAYGAGFMVSKIGGDSAGPTAKSPSSLYWNPAAIGRLSGTHLYLDNNLIHRVGEFTRDTTHVDGANGQVFDTAELTSTSAQPMLAVTSDLGTDALTLGLGAYVPYGSSSEWPDSDGPQRYEGIFGRIRGVYVTSAVTWTAVPGLHLSFAPSYVGMQVQTYRARDLAGVVSERTGTEVETELPENEGRVYVDVDGHGFAYAFGALWEVGDLVLGASYSSEVNVDLDGTLSVFLPRNGFYQSLRDGDVEEAATFKTTWPRAVRGGIAWNASERWSFSVKLEWVQWSLYDTVEIDVAAEDVAGVGDLDTTETIGWQDTTNVRVGGRYYFTPDFAVFGGGGIENGAIPEERLTPSIVDMTKFGLALGVMWRPTPDVEINVGYTHIEFLETEATKSVTELPYTGEYSQRVEFLNTNVSWRIAD